MQWGGSGKAPPGVSQPPAAAWDVATRGRREGGRGHCPVLGLHPSLPAGRPEAARGLQGRLHWFLAPRHPPPPRAGAPGVPVSPLGPRGTPALLELPALCYLQPSNHDRRSWLSPPARLRGKEALPAAAPPKGAVHGGPPFSLARGQPLYPASRAECVPWDTVRVAKGHTCPAGLAEAQTYPGRRRGWGPAEQRRVRGARPRS